jgi:WD40 repeat protein
VTADGKLAVSASLDQTLKVWDLESGKELQTLTGHRHWVYGWR